MPYLLHKDTDGSVIQFWNLHDGPLTIGRGSEANARVDDQALSKTHLKIVHETAGFTLSDLGSKNGTKLNGQAVQQAVLKPNDQITAGNSKFLFVEGLTTLAGKMKIEEDKLGHLAPPAK